MASRLPEMLLFELGTSAAAETEQLGRDLGAELGRPRCRPLGAGTTWLLTGEMGAGKTVLIRGVCRGLGVRGRIRSPGFTLVTSYRGEIPIVHVDLYRLEDPAQVEGLGITDLVPPEAILLVEWGERAESAVDADRFEIGIEHRGADERRIRLHARGGRSTGIGRTLAAALGWPAPDHAAPLARARVRPW